MDNKSAYLFGKHNQLSLDDALAFYDGKIKINEMCGFTNEDQHKAAIVARSVIADAISNEGRESERSAKIRELKNEISRLKSHKPEPQTIMYRGNMISAGDLVALCEKYRLKSELAIERSHKLEQAMRKLVE